MGSPMSTTIESRTVDGQCYLSAVDLVSLLRGRADEVEALATVLGDDLDGEQYTTAVAYHTVALELRDRADWLDIAVIAHLTDHPGDSPSPKTDTPGG